MHYQSSLAKLGAAGLLYVFFSGGNAVASSHLYNDTWAYYVDEGRWEELHPQGEPPPPNHGYWATYDPVNQRMLIGGSWQLSLELGEERWEPQERPEGAMIGVHYSESRQTLYRPTSAGLHWWNLATDEFSSKTMTNWAWTGLIGSTAVDDARGRLVDFGRNRLITYTIDGDVSQAHHHADLGDVPPVFDFFKAAIDPVRDRMIIFGGSEGEHAIYPYYSDQTYELDLETMEWTRIDTDAAPSPRGQYGAAWDPVMQRMYVLCGLYRLAQTDHSLGPSPIESVSTYNEVWVYDSTSQTWSVEMPEGTRPGVRRQPSAVFDAENRRIILFGGEIVNGPPPSRAVVRSPQSGRRVSGNRVTILAELLHGTPAETDWVRFQYRIPSLSGTWTDVVPANPNHNNPDTAAPYFVHWDITGFEDGPADLRAIARSSTGVIDPRPELITVIIDRSQPHGAEDAAADSTLLVYTGRDGFGDFATGSTHSSASTVLRLRHDPGTLPDGTVVNLNLIGSTLEEGLWLPWPHSAARLTLNEGASTSTLEPYRLLYSYPANFLAASGKSEEDLTIYWLSNSGRLVEIRDVVVDQQAKRVEGTTTATGVFFLSPRLPDLTAMRLIDHLLDMSRLQWWEFPDGDTNLDGAIDTGDILGLPGGPPLDTWSKFECWLFVR